MSAPLIAVGHTTHRSTGVLRFRRIGALAQGCLIRALRSRLSLAGPIGPGTDRRLVLRINARIGDSGGSQVQGPRPRQRTDGHRQASSRERDPGPSGRSLGSEGADARRGDGGPQPIERLRHAPHALAFLEHAESRHRVALGEHSRDAHRRPDAEDDRPDDQQHSCNVIRAHTSVRLLEPPLSQCSPTSRWPSAAGTRVRKVRMSTWRIMTKRRDSCSERPSHARLPGSSRPG